MVPEYNIGLYGNENVVDFNINAKSLKELEKLEKRRIKEENTRQRKLQEKEKEQEKKMKRKLKQNAKDSNETPESQFGRLTIADNLEIPVFLVKCVQFIEKEGLDSEGIYRVPGSRAHVDLLFHNFEEGKLSIISFFFPNYNSCSLFLLLLDYNTNIDALDIPVNAVATALKDFFSKRLPPLFSKDIIKELEEIAGKLIQLKF